VALLFSGTTLVALLLQFTGFHKRGVENKSNLEINPLHLKQIYSKTHLLCCFALKGSAVITKRFIYVSRNFFNESFMEIFFSPKLSYQSAFVPSKLLSVEN
jgi:hypothetical protein